MFDSSMEATIRRAATADLDAIVRIEETGRGRWTRDQFAEELALSFSEVHVLEIGGEVVGFAVAWRMAGDIQINNIAILPDRRRQGLGTMLLMHAARGRGGKVLLEVDATNMAAIRFYEKNGFRATARRRRYYGDSDAILMERDAV